MKKLLVVLCVCMGTWPLAACFDGVQDAITGGAQTVTDKVMDSVEQGLAAASPAVDAQVQSRLDQIEASYAGAANGANCAANSECASGHCPVPATGPRVCTP